MTLQRRTLLKGLSLGAGSLLLSPMVRKLQAEARGEAPGMRLVFVVEGNGLPPEQIQPEGIKRPRKHERTELVDTSLDGHELPPSLAPLEKHRDRLTILQGLSGRICGGGHSNNFGALGAYQGKENTVLGETIDVALAKALPPAIFSHVGLGISSKPQYNIAYNCSAWEANKKLPTVCDPELAYNNLFGSVAEGNARRQFNARRSVLDFLVDDIGRLERRLAGEEREKLQSYMGAFETMRNRQNRLREIEGVLEKHAPTPSDKYTSGVETDRLDAHFEMATAALVSGLTNVVTLASGVGDAHFSVKFTGLGIDFGKHSIGHGGKYLDWTAGDMSVMIRTFHFELIARMADALARVPEGDGTMLDNTLIVYLSDAAESHHARCWEWPFVMLGNLGGRMRGGNRYLEYPYHGLAGHRTISSFYTSLLHAAGAPRDRFGMADPTLGEIDAPGPLSELMA